MAASGHAGLLLPTTPSTTRRGRIRRRQTDTTVPRPTRAVDPLIRVVRMFRGTAAGPTSVERSRKCEPSHALAPTASTGTRTPWSVADVPGALGGLPRLAPLDGPAISVDGRWGGGVFAAGSRAARFGCRRLGVGPLQVSRPSSAAPGRCASRRRGRWPALPVRHLKSIRAPPTRSVRLVRRPGPSPCPGHQGDAFDGPGYAGTAAEDGDEAPQVVGRAARGVAADAPPHSVSGPAG